LVIDMLLRVTACAVDRSHVITLFPFLVISVSKDILMARITWKGTISFGLLHAPVSLYPASHPDEIDFDWLTRDTLEPVGYKRVVKKTGEEVDKNNVVRAIKQDDGSYVVCLIRKSSLRT